MFKDTQGRTLVQGETGYENSVVDKKFAANEQANSSLSSAALNSPESQGWDDLKYS